MAKYCTQCGAKLDDDDLFCGVCGVSLSEEQNGSQPANNGVRDKDEPVYEPIVERVAGTSKTTKKKSSLFAILAAVAVIAILIICIIPKGSDPVDDGDGFTTQQGGDNRSHKNVLSDAEVKSIAKALNEEINFFGDTSDAYNLEYSDFKIESDDYNRYIVCMHYQYEDAKRNYHNGDVIVYFRYIPETDQYQYKRTNIKFPMKTLSEEYLINRIKEDAEFGWGTDPNSPVINEHTEESPENNTPNATSVWEEAYTDVITDAMREFPQHQSACSYSVFDIDKDGTPELLLKVGTCEADYQARWYCYENGSADCFATLDAGHLFFCGLGNQNAFLSAYGHQGYETITKHSYINGNLYAEIVFDGGVQNYHELSYLPSFALDDFSGLKWTANTPDNNQSVLDNYTPASDRIIAAEITNENFEQVVSLDKRSDWYDNGIFSSYFASCDHQSNVTWEYIGTTSDIFGVSYYECSDVDVFRVDYSAGVKSYLFVPYNKIIGNPPVVFLFFGYNEIPMEIWNGNY